MVFTGSIGTEKAHLGQHHSNHLHELCMKGGPSKEHGTNKPPLPRRVWERSKGDTIWLIISQKTPQWHPSWLSDVWATRKESWIGMMAKDNLETSPVTIKSKAVSHVAEQFSWVPLPYCPLPRCPFPIKSLSACKSPQTIHFWVLDKIPLLDPGRDPTSCNMAIHFT